MGFSTAAGKAVHISDAARARGAALLASSPFKALGEDEGGVGVGGAPVGDEKDQVSERQVPEADTSAAPAAPPPRTTRTGFGGFSTATGRAVVVSDQMRAKAATFSQSQSHDEAPLAAAASHVANAAPSNAAAPQVASRTGFGGFSTAAGRAFVVTDEMRAKAASIFSESQPSVHEAPPAAAASHADAGPSHAAPPHAAPPPPAAGGFRFGNGTAAISEAAKAKAQALLGLDGSNGDDDDDELRRMLGGEVSGPSGLVGKAQLPTLANEPAAPSKPAPKAFHTAAGAIVTDRKSAPAAIPAPPRPAAATAGRPGFKPPRRSEEVGGAAAPAAGAMGPPAARRASESGPGKRARFVAPRSAPGVGALVPHGQHCAAPTTSRPVLAQRAAQQAQTPLQPTAQVKRCACTRIAPIHTRVRCPCCCMQCGLTLERPGECALHGSGCPNGD